MMKINLLILLCFFLHACSGFTEAGKVLRNEKKETTDEFLVKKKQPLVLPPDYDKIPEPGSIKENQEAEEDNLKKILKAPKEMDAKKKETSTENLILENIRK
jgi:hypothetical protein